MLGARSFVSPRGIVHRSLHGSTILPKAPNAMPFISVAAGAFFLYNLEEMKSSNVHLISSKLCSVLEHLSWLRIGRLGDDRWRSLNDQPQQDETSISHQQQNARFPSLKARLVQSAGPDQQTRDESTFPINSDDPIPIDNHLFKGTVTFVLRPLRAEDDPVFQQRVPLHREQSGDDIPSFYFHLQGKFKRPIQKDALLVGGELLDPFVMDRTMSSWTRQLSQLLLRLLASNIGTNMFYSFGGERGRNKNKEAGVEYPHIAFPVESAMSIDQDLDGSSCSPDVWDTDTVYSLMYCASSIDLASWKVTYPFEMDVRKFWGDSPLRLVIYEKPTDGQEHNNYVFELQLENIK
jgi:hypothetical protein